MERLPWGKHLPGRTPESHYQSFMKTAYVGIGSNLGDRKGHCLAALEEMAEIPGCIVLDNSDWYLTEPVGVEDQDWYVNGVAALSAEMSAQDLLRHLLAIEKRLGRVRTERWGPRTIDLDLLLFGQEIIDNEDLKVPHPLMHLRRFVIVPLAQIAPHVIHPVLGVTVGALLERFSGSSQNVIPLK
jgi:2-amino-4-hydroxy-6-hydroxymethyldihydropteridine diphosphokinase